MGINCCSVLSKEVLTEPLNGLFVRTLVLLWVVCMERNISCLAFMGVTSVVMLHLMGGVMMFSTGWLASMDMSTMVNRVDVVMLQFLVVMLSTGLLVFVMVLQLMAVMVLWLAGLAR